MLTGVVYKFQVWTLQRSKRRIEKAFNKKLKKARAVKVSNDKIESLVADERFETGLISDELQTLHSSYLMRQAEILDIPIPAFTTSGPGYEKWTQSEVTGRYRLSDDARHDLRALVEAAAKAKREALTWWIPIIFGLIGAITGLTAVLEKSHHVSPPHDVVKKIPLSEIIEQIHSN